MTTPLDYSAFPHILERVLELLDTKSLWKIRGVSSSLREYADAQLFQHVVLRQQPGCRARGELMAPNRIGRVMLVPRLKYAALWVQYAPYLKYVEILDVVDPFDMPVSPLEIFLDGVALATAAGSTPGSNSTESGSRSDKGTTNTTATTVTKRKHRICVRAFQPKTRVPACPRLDMDLCAVRIWESPSHPVLSRPAQCTRYAQIAENLFQCPYFFTTLDNVVYVPFAHDKWPEHPGLLHHGYLLQNLTRRSPAFSLTVVVEEPDRYLHWLCRGSMESVERFRKLPNFHIVGIEEYAAENPDLVVRELGLDTMGITDGDITRMVDAGDLMDLWHRYVGRGVVVV